MGISKKAMYPHWPKEKEKPVNLTTKLVLQHWCAEHIVNTIFVIVLHFIPFLVTIPIWGEIYWLETPYSRKKASIVTFLETNLSPLFDDFNTSEWLVDLKLVDIDRRNNRTELKVEAFLVKVGIRQFVCIKYI